MHKEKNSMRDVPRTPGYVDTSYLQAAADLVQPTKKRSYELLRIAPNQSVLDVGCGPGIDTLAMAELVGPQGRVLGLDADPEMVEIAQTRTERAGLTERVEHRQGDAANLPLESRTFDACRSERLFIHLGDPSRALGEMRRVARPGAWIVLVDSDWGSLSIDSPHVGIERRLARFRAEQLLSNGYSGRQLFRLFKESGLTQIEVEAWPVVIAGDGQLLRYLTKLDEVERKALEAGVMTDAEIATWRQGLEHAERQGVAFCSMNLVLAAGRVPKT